MKFGNNKKGLNMKNTLMVLMFVLVMAACGNKQATPDVMVTSPDSVEATDVSVVEGTDVPVGSDVTPTSSEKEVEMTEVR
jgi:hypothetical protein